MMQLVKFSPRRKGRGRLVRGDMMAEQPTQPEQAGTSPLASPAAFSNNAVHLVRTTQQINMMLSQMADAKASILMGATFLVFTIAVGQARGGALPWSLGVLALFSFVSAMCAVFAVLPSVGRPEAAAREGARPNLLFFGTFTRMDEEMWTANVLEDLRTDETVFRAMLHDIYQNGQVLQRKKYRYLAYAYKSFMLGLTLTAITFVLEYAITPF